MPRQSDAQAYFFVFRNPTEIPSSLNSWCTPYSGLVKKGEVHGRFYSFYESARAPEEAMLAGKLKLVKHGLSNATILLIERSTTDTGFTTVFEENDNG